jgi:RHS repeat-associated protein
VTVSYDNNGNLLTDNLNTYTWSAYGNPGSINSIALVYDALGRMVEQQNGSTYTQILYSPVGKTAIMNGLTLTKAFVGLPGGGTAIYKSSGLAYYRHADWLGSSRLTSTVSSTVYSDSAYAPFGEQYALSGTADPSFTGQDSDTVSSLYDFAYRENSPSQGRWISPDPAGLAAVDPTNPQTWNRYAYVTNQPLSFTDPLGLDGCTQPSSEIPCFPVTSLPGCPTILVPGCTPPPPGCDWMSSAGSGEGSGFTGENCTVSTPAPPPNCPPNAPGCNSNGQPCNYVTANPCSNGGGGGGATGPPTPMSQTQQQCVSDFYNSTLGKAVQFGSPLALLPGWNPQAGQNLQEWGIAIFGKLGGLFGSGAISGTTQLTTLNGTTTVGSTLELGTEAALEALEKAATPAMVVATTGDIAAHMGCVGGPDANVYLYQGSLMGGGN